jgi:hypothetical protein
MAPVAGITSSASAQLAAHGIHGSVGTTRLSLRHGDGAALRARCRRKPRRLRPRHRSGPDAAHGPRRPSLRSAPGAKQWPALAAFGRDGVSRLVGWHVALARRFASGLSAEDATSWPSCGSTRSWPPVITDEMIAAAQRVARRTVARARLRPDALASRCQLAARLAVSGREPYSLRVPRR